MFRAARGTSCVFVIERLDRAAKRALSDLGDKSVLCKPVHREQLEATCLLALGQRERHARRDSRIDECAQERLVEQAALRIAEAVAHALRAR